VSELAELYLIFVVLYLFECLAWVPRRAVGFFGLLGRRRARVAFRPNVGWSSSVVVGQPWPPLAPPWFGEPLPFALDPQGITLTEADGGRLAWEALAPIVARDSRVESGEQLSCKLASRHVAKRVAEALEKIRVASPKKRAGELGRFLDARFDVAAARARWQAFARSVRPLRVLSNALWLALFGGLGVAVGTQNMLYLLAAAALTLLLWPVNAFVFTRTLRKQAWLAKADGPDLSKRLVTVLSPLSAVRAVDVIARELWANLEPLAVATVLLGPRELSSFARPLLVAAEAREGDPLSWWHAELRLRMLHVLAEREIRVEALLAPPIREGTHVTRYCPACLAQYEGGAGSDGTCPNDTCHDIPLRAFASEVKPASSSEGKS
jgi:hypothetical protein